jgi:hypothetical protein
MSLDDVNEMDRLRRAWPDAEPPAALERAVRREAHRLLAGRRVAREAGAAGAYPDWLVVLTAALLLPGLVVAQIVATRQGLWPAVQQALGAAPLSRAWLVVLASNLLAALLAPALIMWRRAYGD